MGCWLDHVRSWTGPTILCACGKRAKQLESVSGRRVSINMGPWDQFWTQNFLKENTKLDQNQRHPKERETWAI
ncbi:hypothetical protein YC2023_033636 [Brassica napus]